jgi:hypothetical protein
MRAQVTDQGVVIPRSMLPEADEVEIRRENGRVVVEAVPPGSIWDLGREPLPDDLADGSVAHDHYLYGLRPLDPPE